MIGLFEFEMNLGKYRYIGALNASCYTARVQRSDLTAARRKFLEIRGLLDFILFNSMACVAGVLLSGWGGLV